MLIGICLYFLFCISVLGLLVLAPLRDWAAAGVRPWWRIGRGVRAAAATRARAIRRRGPAIPLRQAFRVLARALRRHGVAVGLAVVVVGAAPLTAWWLRDAYRTDSYDATVSREVDAQVALLLQGEQLVPPPPLPPALFTAAEVEQWQPLARHASRQWELLDATFSARLLLAFRLMRERYGYDMVLIEGYRSPQRQAALARLGPSVTRAGPSESYHQYGLAADCAFLRDGRIVISERDPWAMQGYRAYGQVARSLGLVWGGDWRALKDYGHVEHHRPGPTPR